MVHIFHNFSRIMMNRGLKFDPIDLLPYWACWLLHAARLGLLGQMWAWIWAQSTRPGPWVMGWIRYSWLPCFSISFFLFFTFCVCVCVFFLIHIWKLQLSASALTTALLHLQLTAANQSSWPWQWSPCLQTCFRNHACQNLPQST